MVRPTIPLKDVDLFAITLTGNGTTVCVATDTAWNKQGNGEDTEVRSASAVKDGRRFRWMREHHEIVRTRDELHHFLRSGGHALVGGELIVGWWPAFFNPVECRRHHDLMPFIAIRHPPKATLQRTLTPDSHEGPCAKRSWLVTRVGVESAVVLLMMDSTSSSMFITLYRTRKVA